MSAWRIEATGLRRSFVSRNGATVAALDGVSAVLPGGALTVVRGPSGCGKSTLLNLIGLLDRPTAGALRLGGVEVASLDARKAAAFRRDHLGFLFQDAGLIEPMSVFENLATPLRYRGVGRSMRKLLIAQVLDRVGLGARAGSAVAEMSGGERQRVGLARALVCRPALLVCDEPTAALDAGASAAVADMLAAEARAGLTVVCSSHDPILIGRADKVLSLAHGRAAA